MDTCAVETGLLKKKPCGEKAVTKCANCEMALCAKHATSRMSGGKKTFLCQECAKAWKESDKLGELPSTPAAAPGAAKAAEKAPAAAAKPAAAAPKPAPKPAAAPPKPAAAAPAKKEEKKPDHDDDAPLEFTPTKK